MKLKKALLVTGAASTVGLSSIIGVGVASAQSNTTTTNKPTGIVDEIAQKFNLNKQDVQAVFKQHHQEMEAYRQQKLQAALDKDVQGGKITSSQETQILDKLKQLQSYRDSLKGKTPAERRQLMQQERSQLLQWAQDNNIPTDIAPFLHGPKNN